MLSLEVVEWCFVPHVMSVTRVTFGATTAGLPVMQPQIDGSLYQWYTIKVSCIAPKFDFYSIYSNANMMK